MGRMTTRLRSAAAFLAAAVLTLSTCSNPVNLLEEATVEVMQANDRYLEVVDFGPENNATEISPSSTIWMEFDRTLDEDTVTPSTIEITPSVEWTFSYNDTTKTLSIQPVMSGPQTYTVVLKTGLKGTDGRPLFEERAWSFTTKLGPSGTVSINAGAKYTTANDGNTLNVYANEAAYSYRYSLTIGDLSSASWTAISTQTFTINPVSLSGVEGANQVYIQFRNVDDTDRTSIVTPINDSIILDTVPPVVSSFTINSGAVGTTSTSVTLSQTMSDATSGVKYMQFMNTGGSWSSNQKPSSTKEWTLASAVGTRQVSARITDFAGNTTTVSDSIIYGAPTVTSATLNSTTVGTVTVGWNTATSDVGTNYYYVYRRDYPSGTTYTYCGNTTSTSLNFTVTQGALYYFHVAIYNSSAGGVGGYSTTSALGYTSNIAIIYPTTDATIASDLKTTLTNSSGWADAYDGTMPGWSVTLIPESLVSSTYSVANTFCGDPIIITPNSTLYLTSSKVRNVTAHSHGVVAMGYGGCKLLDVVNSNFSTWGYSSYSVQAPTEIGYLPSAYPAASYYGYTCTTGNSVWTNPLSSSFIPSTNATSVQLAYSSVSRIAVYWPSGTYDSGIDLYPYCGESSFTYFPVVRQGRFLQYGFYIALDRPSTGKILTVNLVNRMSMF